MSLLESLSSHSARGRPEGDSRAPRTTPTGPPRALLPLRPQLPARHSRQHGNTPGATTVLSKTCLTRSAVASRNGIITGIRRPSQRARGRFHAPSAAGDLHRRGQRGGASEQQRWNASSPVARPLRNSSGRLPGTRSRPDDLARRGDPRAAEQGEARRPSFDAPSARASLPVSGASSPAGKYTGPSAY